MRWGPRRFSIIYISPSWWNVHFSTEYVFFFFSKQISIFEQTGIFNETGIFKETGIFNKTGTVNETRIFNKTGIIISRQIRQFQRHVHFPMEEAI